MRRFLIHTYDSSVDVWDGTVGPWPEYDSNGNFHVKTCAEWAALAASGDYFDGPTIYIDKDLDFYKVCYYGDFKDFVAFPSLYQLKGTIEGNNHLISAGFIVGGIVQTVFTGGTIRSLRVSTAYKYVYADAFIAINTNTLAYGTIAANVYGKNPVIDCVNENGGQEFDSLGGAGNTKLYVGGIVGYAASGTSISKCTNKGNINVRSSIPEVYVGGVIGYSASQELDSVVSCLNTGEISGSNYQNESPVFSICGIAGRCDGTISSCVNTGAIRGSGAQTAGIGMSSASLVINSCINQGTVSSNWSTAVANPTAYGIGVGYSMIRCANTGSISSSAWNVPTSPQVYDIGAASYTISECHNSGYLSATIKHTVGTQVSESQIPCRVLLVNRWRIPNFKFIELIATNYPTRGLNASTGNIKIMSGSTEIQSLVPNQKIKVRFTSTGTFDVISDAFEFGFGIVRPTIEVSI